MPASGKKLGTAIIHIDQEYQQCIKPLAGISAKLNDVPTRTGRSKKYYEQLDSFLAWLEKDVPMTPDLKKKSKIVLALEDIFAKPQFHFPNQYTDKARALYEKWEAADWKDERGEDSDDDDDDEVEMASGGKATRSRATSGLPSPGTVRLPPPAHAVWGLQGIMHGVAMRYSSATKRAIILDPRYEKREAKVIGANGLAIGAWYPRQLVALFNGAHGHQQAGICGSADEGAYSIVVSGQYDTLDNDCGTFLYYSGSRSHDNENPREPAPSTQGTLALHTSLTTGEPVRVLCAASAKSTWAPFCGLRYDGLYTVVKVSHPRNAKGGLYEQFKLERNAGQEEMEWLKRVPGAREMEWHDKINRANTLGWECLNIADRFTRAGYRAPPPMSGPLTLSKIWDVLRLPIEVDHHDYEYARGNLDEILIVGEPHDYYLPSAPRFQNVPSFTEQDPVSVGSYSDILLEHLEVLPKTYQPPDDAVMSLRQAIANYR